MHDSFGCLEKGLTVKRSLDVFHDAVLFDFPV